MMFLALGSLYKIKNLMLGLSVSSGLVQPIFVSFCPIFR